MKVAIIDLYGADDNSGIGAIESIIHTQNPHHLVQTFQVRLEDEWPEIIDWDVFILSGGPGNPADDQSEWSQNWKQFMQGILQHNQTESTPKSAFLICFSFQLFCHHFELGVTSKRAAPSYGPYACHLTLYGKKDIIFGQLPEKFQIADFRFFQVTQPNQKNLDAMGAQVLALEKLRPKVDKEQALMAIKFTDEIYGCQFHPEANGVEVRDSFLSEKDKFINILGQKHYDKIIKKLESISGLNQTNEMVLPQFLAVCTQKYD